MVSNQLLELIMMELTLIGLLVPYFMILEMGLPLKITIGFLAEVVRPYVRDEITWVIEHHGIFQMIYYAHHYGWDKNARDKFKDNIYFQTCADFCERWDQKSFDPEYENKDLDFFKPLIKEVFSRPPYKDEYIKKNEVLGLPKV